MKPHRKPLGHSGNTSARANTGTRSGSRLGGSSHPLRETEMDYQFRSPHAEIIREDLRRNAGPDQVALLHDPGHLDVWVEDLEGFLHSLEEKLRSHWVNYDADIIDALATGVNDIPAFLARMNDQASWRRRQTTLQRAIRKKLREINTIRVQALVAGIQEHRRTMLADDIEASEHDLRLWELCDKVATRHLAAA